MRNAVPVEHLLFLLSPNAVVLVHEIQERAFGLLQGRIGASFEISQIRENSFLEFFRVLDGAAKCLESKSETSYNVSTRDMEEVAPEVPNVSSA